MKGNSRYFCNYMSSKGKLEKTWAPVQGAWNVVTDVEKAGVLGACFAFVLVKSAQDTETLGKVFVALESMSRHVMDKKGEE